MDPCAALFSSNLATLFLALLLIGYLWSRYETDVVVLSPGEVVSSSFRNASASSLSLPSSASLPFPFNLFTLWRMVLIFACFCLYRVRGSGLYTEAGTWCASAWTGVTSGCSRVRQFIGDRVSTSKDKKDDVGNADPEKKVGEKGKDKEKDKTPKDKPDPDPAPTPPPKLEAPPPLSDIFKAISPPGPIRFAGSVLDT